MMTQRESILAHLKKHGSITPMEALDMYGCFRLGARIKELREMGFNIRTVMVHKDNPSGRGKAFARYDLEADA